ncbi:hypothetical protein Tcan_09340 [Toxocara canis]|uniref:Uncharacterized protein n=1 Tax=Toxocara canis TaxID=6265 RepID=A0A0B2V299_TOXCA|nr:hypothetical protein Tcan_09340 [Toxocara canis]
MIKREPASQPRFDSQLPPGDQAILLGDENRPRGRLESEDVSLRRREWIGEREKSCEAALIKEILS